jgi:microcystin-dependent protein
VAVDQHDANLQVIGTGPFRSGVVPIGDSELYSKKNNLNPVIFFVGREGHMRFLRLCILAMCGAVSFASTAQSQMELKAAVGTGPVVVGTMVAFGGKMDQAMEAALAEAGWLPCDGRPLSLKTVGGGASPYVGLHTIIQTNFGNGTDTDGVKKGDFNIPDLRGTFVRGVTQTSGNDPDANSRAPMRPGGNVGNQVGSVQTDAIEAHSHPSSATLTPENNPNVFVSQRSAPADFVPGLTRGSDFHDEGASVITRRRISVSVNVGNSVGSETRPVNAYVHWIIRYK